ncbi:hypothetical protein TOPH_04311 [Tolypocladium ophioglossoides CBS 100239]|uniref:Rhodopsin domain-containing protein n=1 Tax=Tolypocladium ophioglossoides (strain CBS 100239) TaxID=1163406 RepID=A0A0L0NA38_TOLOC|nr:hypothetical protein TOPH_04311 [Tolypocladium ophioglossoides CBS 100239]
MATPFQSEAWAEYGLGVFILFLRFFARWKAVGFKKWEGDDFFAILVLIFWTLELCMLELIGTSSNISASTSCLPIRRHSHITLQTGQNGTNIGITDEKGALLTEEEISKLEFGSKCLLAGWNFYVTLIWTLKGCMLCYYNRITLGLTLQKFVKWTGVACILAYAGVLGAIWGHCMPVQKNWQVVPYPGDKCTLAVANYLTLVVLNVLTDTMIVTIPVPLLWKVKIPIGRKIAIGVLLCSGVFIIVATVLRCVLSLRDIQGINVSTIWAIRETFVGIIAVNAACIKPLFSKGRWITSSKGSSATPGAANGYSMGHMRSGSTPGSISKRRFNKLGSETEIADNSSEENMVNPLHYNKWLKSEVRGGGSHSERDGSVNDDGFTVTTRVEVHPDTVRQHV